MREKKSYAVFGLGRYGLAVAEELVRAGADVLAVDRDEAAVAAAADRLPVCKCANATDRDVMAALGVRNVDVAVVAMAGRLEDSILVTMLLKEAGVPFVIAKCAGDLHGEILRRVGADKVVFPERDSGVRLAKNLLSAGFVDMIELSGEAVVVEIAVDPRWEGKTLRELELRRRHGLNVVAIRRGERVDVAVDPEEKLTGALRLVVIASPAALKKLER